LLPLFTGLVIPTDDATRQPAEGDENVRRAFLLRQFRGHSQKPLQELRYVLPRRRFLASDMKVHRLIQGPEFFWAEQSRLVKVGRFPIVQSENQVAFPKNVLARDFVLVAWIAVAEAANDGSRCKQDFFDSMRAARAISTRKDIRIVCR